MQYIGAVFFRNLLFQVCSPLHDSFVFFPCLSDSLLSLPFHPSLPPSLHLSFSCSSSPQTPGQPPHQQSSCDTPTKEAMSGRSASRNCTLFSSHTTETADYNYFDSPPPVCVVRNSSCMKLLSCSQWTVGEWMTFQ